MKTIAVIFALTLIALNAVNVAATRMIPQVPARVDTVRVETTIYSHDSITVISRAADTVRIYVRQVGRLTQRDLVNLICSEKWLNDGSGEFAFNGYGMVFCPKSETK